MIFLRLGGGLGNQIFQLGAAMLLANYSRTDHLVIDDSFLSNYKSKRSNDLLELFDFNRAKVKIEFSRVGIAKYRLPKVLPLKLNFWPFISDRNFQFSLRSTTDRNRYLDGYFQECITQKNFDDIRTLLAKIFISRQEISDPSICAIHIRGGDFLKLGWNTVASPFYYHKAIRFMLSHHKIRHFLVVTDDIDYATQIMSSENVNYEAYSSDTISDFNIISSAQRKIISNSTFSLWASSIREMDDSAVISPRYLRPGVVRPFRLPGEHPA